jgi:hypothetical protein
MKCCDCGWERVDNGCGCIPPSKLCSKCKIVKSFDQFDKNYQKPDGLRYDCKECRRARRRLNRQQNKQKFLQYEHKPEVKRSNKNSSFKRNYGITLEQYELMLEKQNYMCKICQNIEKHKTKINLSVDHCHETKEVRGLLCNNCNLAIGLFNDNINILERTITYLKGML